MVFFTKIMSSANYYDKMTHEQHILDIPDTYVGSDEQIPYLSRILVETEHGLSIVEQTVSVPEAVSRLFNEILSNASDNADRSRKAGIPIGKVEIFVDHQTVIIRNGGRPIPIEIHPKEGVYAPELIFGHLLTSSNYNKEVDRTGCGRNGYGAKLVNIFSKAFQVRVGDAERNLEYLQQWSDNKSICYPPIITEYHGESYVEISYQLDFRRFGYEEYPDEAIALFAKYAADTSLMMKIPVVFNGKEFNFGNIKDYAKLLFGTDNNMLVIELPGAKEDDLPSELCLVDTPNNAVVISSINGMMTLEGGVHVDAAYKLITGSVLEKINSTVKVHSKEKNNKVAKLTKEDLKQHISMLIICHLPNPKFNAQTKTILKSPTPKFELTEREEKKIMKWKFVDYLYDVLDMKQDKILAKTNGKKRKHVNVAKLEDANEAGGPNSRNCTLYVTEGLSAMGYAERAISLTPSGRDYFGIYPMKGKPLNVMNASRHQISLNEEIAELKNVLGLEEGVDYTDDANFNKLRYGYFVILADSDDDGKHIVGLILNIFFCRWRSLLERNYVMFLRTPILRTIKGNQQHCFFTEDEYEVWKQQTPDHDKWKTKYYKGLGTSTPSDIKEDMQNPKIVICYYDGMAATNMQLAFDDRLADHRKRWIAEYRELHQIVDMQLQPISDFINSEFIKFSITSVSRSIPSRVDGLKPSQRKAIWGAFCKWKGNVGKDAEEFKVARFANFVAEKTDYHHGEKCMCDTVVNMAQDFVGANNLPYFTSDGNFGTRNMNGKNASDTRYIFTRPNWWLRHVFKDEDKPLLTLLQGEKSDTIEPRFLLPILPMSLLNGAHGIATAWSTYIPQHNPLDVIGWYIAKLTDQPLPDVLPWYRGFIGNVKLVHRHVRSKPTPDDQTEQTDGVLDPDEEFVDFNTKSSLVTEGLFTVPLENQDTIVVTELPIGRATHDYKGWLEKLIAEKKIKDFSNKSTVSRVRFIIEGMEAPSLKKLRLVKSFGLSNMVLLDENHKPRKYATTIDILEEFYELRLPYYEARRQKMLDDIQRKIIMNNDKIRFIYAIINGEIIIHRRPKQEIHETMDQLQIPRYLLDKTKLTSLTEEDILKMQREIQRLETEYSNLEQKHAKQIWLEDLQEFEKAYTRYYDNEWIEDEEIVNDNDDIKVQKKRRSTKGKTSTRGRGKAKAK